VIHRSEVDGVPVVWTEGPAPLSARLLFRVGVRDETFRIRGVTDLVQRLATGRIEHDLDDASVEVDTTVATFAATGAPDAVAAYLTELCRSLGDLPTTDLTATADEVTADDNYPVPVIVADLLFLRFGYQGLGLSGVLPGIADQIPADAVVGFARRCFSRGNAVLALTGRPPPGLLLPLPDGPRLAVPGDRDADIALPAWEEFPAGVTLSFRMSDHGSAVAWTVCHLAVRRGLEDLRDRRGSVTALWTTTHRSASDYLVTLGAEAEAEHADEVWRSLLAILRELRDVGPTADELAQLLADYQSAVVRSGSDVGDTLSLALAELLGEPPIRRQESVKLQQRVTPAQCRESLAQLDATLLVGVPEEVEIDDPELPRLVHASGSTVQGRVFPRDPVRGREVGVRRRVALIVGDEGVSRTSPFGPQTIRWKDVVGLGRAPADDEITLYGTDGATISALPEAFLDGPVARDLIAARVPADLHFDEASLATDFADQEDVEA